MSDEDQEARDRAAIHARRLRFVKLAIAGAAVATTQACGQACLSPTVDTGPRDGAVDAGTTDAGTTDAGTTDAGGP